MLLHSICHQVSNQADKFNLVVIILSMFRPLIQVGFLRKMFLTTYNIETRVLETLIESPCLWKGMYVDGFVITKKSKLSEFLTHLNIIESSIQFTKEKVKEGCLLFLDLFIRRSPSCHLLPVVYRKPIHSDKYLTLDQNILYSMNSQWLTLFLNKLKIFPPQPRT